MGDHEATYRRATCKNRSERELNLNIEDSNVLSLLTSALMNDT